MKNNLQDKLKQVINASGRMTKLGVSTQTPYVQSMMKYATDNYFVIDDLYEKAGESIAEMIGVTDVVITSSASAGIVFTVASLICGDNPKLVTDLHNAKCKSSKREVILPKGQSIDYGVPVSTMLELGGGIVIEAGSVNKVTKANVEASISENTIALMYIKSHHCVQKNMISLEDMLELSRKYNISLILDCAAEEDLKKYYDAGADFVVYSGSKALCAPASGFVLCKDQKMAKNMRLQYYGVGRSMKVGKENIFGLVAAIDEYLNSPHKSAVGIDDLKQFIVDINKIEGIDASLSQDEAGRQIFRAKVHFDKDKFGNDAVQVNKLLQSGNPAIYNRDHEANLGYLSFDPRPLQSIDELNKILIRIKEIGGV